MSNKLLLAAACPSEYELISELSQYDTNIRPLVGNMIRKAKESTFKKSLHRGKLASDSLYKEKKYLVSEGVKIYSGIVKNSGYNIKYTNDGGLPQKSLYYNFNSIYSVKL